MRHGMGAEFLRLRPTAEDMQETSPQDIVVFREALIRNKTREGLFASEGEEITFLGGQLFRTRLHFPANVPTGFYDVELSLLQNGSVVHAQTTPLLVRNAGLGVDAHVFATAHTSLSDVTPVLPPPS